MHAVLCEAATILERLWRAIIQPAASAALTVAGAAVGSRQDLTCIMRSTDGTQLAELGLQLTCACVQLAGPGSS